MALSFLPKEYEFFDMFDNLANHCVSASKQIQESVSADNFAQSEVQKIKNIEHAADKITYEIFEKLNNTFITPIDREDIHLLAHELDNIVDLILKISNMVTIYKVDKVLRRKRNGKVLRQETAAACAAAQAPTRTFCGSRRAGADYRRCHRAGEAGNAGRDGDRERDRRWPARRSGPGEAGLRQGQDGHAGDRGVQSAQHRLRALADRGPAAGACRRGLLTAQSCRRFDDH